MSWGFARHDKLLLLSYRLDLSFYLNWTLRYIYQHWYTKAKCFQSVWQDNCHRWSQGILLPTLSNPFQWLRWIGRFRILCHLLIPWWLGSQFQLKVQAHHTIPDQWHTCDDFKWSYGCHNLQCLFCSESSFLVHVWSTSQHRTLTLSVQPLSHRF